jgi:uncharacterized protein DUF5916/cellulose/xylan binding protein with CBM9 domain
MSALLPALCLAVVVESTASGPAAAAGSLRIAPPADTAATAPVTARPTAQAALRPAGRPTVLAARTSGPITIDGVLAEPLWSDGEAFTTLVQRDPVEGAPPSQRTEVRVAYDDDALYVGARLLDSAPDSVVARLARRDASIASDRFALYLDPYHDRRSGYYFMVNAAGTQYDGTLSNDVEDDKSWDGVWEGRARMDDQGWTVEMRIPYSQLRFARNDPQVWGINFMREIPRRRERSYAAYRPRKASGFVSRFPDLVGIGAIAPGRAIELMPYVTTQTEHLDHPPGDPFNDGSRLRGNTGGDLRTRLGGLTLNATGNPDFGTVEIDPATVNLTDVEDFFEEKRPFFVEGAGTFAFGRQGAGDYWDSDWDDPLFFYSRRIGRAPQGRVPSSDFEDVPVATRILWAGKLIGRLGPHWSLGTLHAVTDREVARLADPDTTWKVEIEPLTYYGVTRAQREIGRRAGLGLLSTTAFRTFKEPALRNQLNSASVLAGLDGWLFLDSRETWVLSGWSAVSRVEGNARRMIALQRSSAHYFQRPDASHVDVDSAATSLTGYASRYWINKQKGAVLFNSAVGFLSPSFDVNDLGFMRRSDVVNGHVGSGYKWTRPKRLFRYQTLKAAAFTTLDDGGNVTRRGIEGSSYTEFKNGHTLSLYGTFDAPALNNRRTRGGPLTRNPKAISVGMDYLGNTQQRSYGYLSAGGASSATGSWSAYAYPGAEWKPSAAVSIKLTPGWSRLHEDAQFVTVLTDPASPTNGHRYVFATLDQRTASASLRLNWTFTPRIGLETYVQPFVSSAAYKGFKSLARARSYAFDPSGYTDDLDFTVRSLKGNAVLRWEYRPGSTLFLVWTQRRSESDSFAETSLPLDRVGDARPENIVLIKLSYYLSR